MKPAPRLLITIQAVDLDDTLHGFFHEWLEQAAQIFPSIIVLGLRVGRTNLPKNVEVIALRPKGSTSKMRACYTMLTTSWRRRRDYDAVFVRGDAVYVLAMGWLWRALKKPIILWYAHWMVNRLVPWASHIAQVVTSVPEACSHPDVHPVIIGQAIRETQFTLPSPWPTNRPLSVVIFGRVQKIKQTKDAVEAFQASELHAQSTLTLIGPHVEAGYVEEIRQATARDPKINWGPTSVPYDQVASTMQQFDVMINAYLASLDKTIIEGMMSGQIVIAATNGIKDWLPADLHWLHADTQQKRIEALDRIASMTSEERTKTRERLREAAIQAHSMQHQQQQLRELFAKF